MVTNRTQPLPTFRPNEPVNSKQLQQLSKALRAPMIGVQKPREVDAMYSNQSYFQQMSIVSIQGNYLLCNTFNGALFGAEEIPVAKPFLLRQDTFDGTDDGTYTYAFTDNQTMTVTKNSDSTTETWKVTLDYQAGDLIIAIGNIRGGVRINQSARFEYMDLNTDARAWAKSS